MLHAISDIGFTPAEDGDCCSPRKLAAIASWQFERLVLQRYIADDDVLTGPNASDAHIETVSLAAGVSYEVVLGQFQGNGTPPITDATIIAKKSGAEGSIEIFSGHVGDFIPAQISSVLAGAEYVEINDVHTAESALLLSESASIDAYSLRPADGDVVTDFGVESVGGGSDTRRRKCCRFD